MFDDVYQVIIYAVEESMSAEMRDAVLRFWHYLVEPFFGRGRREYVPLHVKQEMDEVRAHTHS